MPPPRRSQAQAQQSKRMLLAAAAVYALLVFFGMRFLLSFAPDDVGVGGVGVISRAAVDDLLEETMDQAHAQAHPPPPEKQQGQKQQQSDDVYSSGDVVGGDEGDGRSVDKNGIKIVRGEAPLRGPFGPEKLHGRLGVRADGTPGWKMGPPPNRAATAEDVKNNGFFRELSDSLSLDRAVPANRDAQCKALDYDLDSMPQTTVVFVFCNEALSTLLRSIHSVLNRSPPQLLKEIVLIDDFSDLQTRPELGAQLEEYIKLLPAKVRLYRQPARLGLVEARLRGVEEATAETFTILDSHIEAQTGWLEPLMHQIGESPHSVVMPMIDSTDSATFAPRRGGIGCSLGFLWSLIEHVIPLQHQEELRRDSSVASIRSPTMAGGLFSARKDYFLHLGGYDRKWGFWGTENIEFSFRIWQCGGLLECMPCSRVYHVFRHGGSAYDMPGTHLAKNKLRTAAIWMDEFAPVVEYGLGFTPERKAEMVEVREDISEMVALRERLQCKSFGWFLENVYPESKIRSLKDLDHLGPMEFHPWPKGTPAPPFAATGLKMCIDTLHHRLNQAIGTYSCHGMGGSQAFILFANGHWSATDDLDLCVTGSDFRFKKCSQKDDSYWTFDEETGQLSLGLGGANSAGARCVTIKKNSLVLEPCSETKKNSHWSWPAFLVDGRKTT